MATVAIVMQRETRHWDNHVPQPDRPIEVWYNAIRAGERANALKGTYVLILPVQDDDFILLPPIQDSPADDFSQRIAEDLRLSQVIPEGDYMVINEEEYGYDTELDSTTTVEVGAAYPAGWFVANRQRVQEASPVSRSPEE